MSRGSILVKNFTTLPCTLGYKRGNYTETVEDSLAGTVSTEGSASVSDVLKVLKATFRLGASATKGKKKSTATEVTGEINACRIEGNKGENSFDATGYSHLVFVTLGQNTVDLALPIDTMLQKINISIDKKNKNYVVLKFYRDDGDDQGELECYRIYRIPGAEDLKPEENNGGGDDKNDKRLPSFVQNVQAGTIGQQIGRVESNNFSGSINVGANPPKPPTNQ